jgi:Tol biopolymer transport system component
MSRTNSPLVGPAPRAFALGCAALLASACSSSSSPLAPQQQRTQTSAQVADFVYASDASGTPQIYWSHGGTSTRLTFDNSTDDNPKTAAGRLVFTSYRDQNPEIYISNTDGSSQTRLTQSAGLDVEAAIVPTGTHIVFVSERSGTLRLFTMDATGANQTALTTGSETWVPERAPAFSPSGSQIAFTSTRSGISQVYVVPATGGQAVQVTHEAGGAFDPAWSADGSRIVYVSATGTPYLRRVTVASGETVDFAQDTASLGQPACNAQMCLAVSGAYGGTGNLVSVSTAGGSVKHVSAVTGSEASPAFVQQ